MIHKNLKTFFTTTILVLCAQKAAAQLASPPDPCISAPQGASSEVVSCFEQACEVYQKALSDCETQACITAAELTHAQAAGACLLERPAPLPPNGRDSWVTLWYVNGSWSYSFNRIAPHQAIVFRY